MGIWQIIYLAVLMMGLGISIAKHGEPRTGRYHAGATLISIIIEIAILRAGGFFG